MARSQIVSTTADLQTDEGSALFSIVQGEQFEYPVTLPFLENTSNQYEFECSLLEADNVLDQDTPPTTAKLGAELAVDRHLTVYTPLHRGPWAAVTSYDRDDLVSYNGAYFIKTHNSSISDPNTPDLYSAFWLAYTPNKVFIRFPASASTGWSIQPTTKSSIYGFIELRVSEPIGGRYPRTWKPLRGMVEFLYSPTKLTLP